MNEPRETCTVTVAVFSILGQCCSFGTLQALPVSSPFPWVTSQKKNTIHIKRLPISRAQTASQISKGIRNLKKKRLNLFNSVHRKGMLVLVLLVSVRVSSSSQSTSTGSFNFIRLTLRLSYYLPLCDATAVFRIAWQVLMDLIGRIAISLLLQDTTSVITNWKTITRTPLYSTPLHFHYSVA